MEENTRNQMEKDVCTGLKEIFEQIEEIRKHITNEPSHYVSKTGEEYCECCGTYNDYMSRAMASDMFWFQLILEGKYPKLTEMIVGWITKMSKFNYRLMRMIDDDEGDRPMKKWNYKKTCKFVKKIKEAMIVATELYKETHDYLLKDFLDRCKVWATRVIYMNTWAFYLENMEDNEQMLMESQIEMYDNDGNKISGLNEDGRKLMKALCNIRGKLTKMILKIPINSEDYQYIMDILKRFEIIGHIIMKTTEE